MTNTIIFSFLGMAAVILCVVTGAPSEQTDQQNPSKTLDLSAKLNDLQRQLVELQMALVKSSPSQQGVQTQLAASAAQVDQQNQPEQVWPFAQQTADGQIVRTPLKRQMSFQPMKRMVSWQPMKRSPYSSGLYSPFNSDNTNNNAVAKEQVMMTIENELAEVLRAGEKLGISADDILAHLRARNLLQ